MTWQKVPRGRARPQKSPREWRDTDRVIYKGRNGPRFRLSDQEKQEIREAIIEDNKRIEHERTHGDITAKRHPSLRPSVLARRYLVSAQQIRNVTKGLA